MPEYFCQIHMIGLSCCCVDAIENMTHNTVTWGNGQRLKNILLIITDNGRKMQADNQRGKT